ncbi:hypothetical protein JXR93_14620 [bacterium]|nr:hypothetical protein [bacterium]
MSYSPILAVGTGLLELSAFLYFSIIFKNSEKSIKILNLLLLFLAGYQLLEAFNCLYPQYPILVRISFLDITWLPALGVFFAYLSSPIEKKYLKITSYVFLGAAFFFSSIYILNSTSTILKSCQLFYATYKHPGFYYEFYGAYYQLGMLLMLIFTTNNMVEESDKDKRKILSDFAIGSALFIIPSITLVAVIPKFRGSMPSIMCHIAIFLSIFIIKALWREKNRREIEFPEVKNIFA